MLAEVEDDEIGASVVGVLEHIEDGGLILNKIYMYIGLTSLTTINDEMSN